MKIIPVILAGGRGERFWPISHSDRPKQLLSFKGKKTLIQDTFLRASKIIKDKNAKPLLIIGKSCSDAILENLKKDFVFDVIIEPVGKNTAPAIAMAAKFISKKYGDALMLVMPADHYISPLASFKRAVYYGADTAEKSDALIVFGIKPKRPETGYGYIKTGKILSDKNQLKMCNVLSFKEKPDLKTAKFYLKSNKYLWNSGIFLWKTSVILNQIKMLMPDLYKEVFKVDDEFSQKSIDSFYKNCICESIDYGVMEKSKNIVAVIGDFFWDDIGSWESLIRIYQPNKNGTIIKGKNIFESFCCNSIIYNESYMPVATIGLKNIVFVTTNKAILAIDRSFLPEIKKYLSLMKKKNFPEDIF